jgi:hypothetical protein
MSLMRILTRLLSIAFLIAIQSSPSFGQPRPKVVIGYASKSSVVTTLWVAQEKGQQDGRDCHHDQKTRHYGPGGSQ